MGASARSRTIGNPKQNPSGVDLQSEAIFALVYTSGKTGHPNGVAVSHANILANIDHLNYWMRYRESCVHLHAAPIFHIIDFPFMFAALAFGACQVTIPKFSPQSFCETVERERVSQSVLVPTMINMLTQLDKLGNYDLNCLETLAYGGSQSILRLLASAGCCLQHGS
jgi:long-chain acyl-CoA synthetase